MSAFTPKIITRLNPAVPLLWRDGTTVQAGTDGALRINVEEPWVEPLLGKMAAGFRRGSFDVVAHSVGAPRHAARELFARLRPLLMEDAPTGVVAWVESIGLTDGRCEYRMREALEDEGLVIGDRADPRGVGVVLVEGAAAALQFARYLREDIPHVPVSLEHGRMTVGPVVLPGASPCLACRDGHERDRDPAWPRLHAQLIGRSAGPISAARIAEAATLVARLLSDAAADSDAPGAYVDVSGNGERVWRSLTFHEECRCREQSFRSPRGTATEPAPLDQQSGTMTARAYARPA